ncbi:MAG: dihydrofolate reductase [Balneolales bacterium]|nr:dihydrofolate reductase [Balneolales bacterium]
MELALIAAHDENLVIGNEGRLPWNIPEDLKHFKKTTMGFPILMGRGVFDEIGRKPLPGRKNIVLTSQNFDNVPCFSTIEDALKSLQNEKRVFVIGGGQIYTAMIHLCDYMYITEVDGSHDGDVFFPEYRNRIGTDWLEVDRIQMTGFRFIEYKRKP